MQHEYPQHIGVEATRIQAPRQLRRPVHTCCQRQIWPNDKLGPTLSPSILCSHLALRLWQLGNHLPSQDYFEHCACRVSHHESRPPWWAGPAYWRGMVARGHLGTRECETRHQRVHTDSFTTERCLRLTYTRVDCVSVQRTSPFLRWCFRHVRLCRRPSTVLARLLDECKLFWKALPQLCAV